MKELILKHKKGLFLLVIVVTIIIFKIITAIKFNNAEWEPDSYMHFLQLRTVYIDFPKNLPLGLDVWAKPLYIYPLGLIVQILSIKDFLLIEIVNILIFSLIAYLVYKIVLKLYGNYKVAIASFILTSLSLTLFKSSISVLTEPVFTLTLVSSFYFLVNKKYIWASLLVGMCVLARIEGLFFIGLYFLYLIYELKPNIKKLTINGLVSSLPFFFWNFIGFLLTGEILYFKRFFQSYAAGDYGHGSIFSYPKLFITKEFIPTVLFVLATALLIKKFKDFKKQSLVIYSFIIFSLFVLIQIILWLRGSFGTAGLMRYFVSVIPFMIIFIAYFFIKFSNKFGDKALRKFLVVVITLQIIFLIMNLVGIVIQKEFPYKDPDFVTAGEWIKSNYDNNTFVGADRPEILYYAQRDITNSTIYFGDDFRNNKPGIYILSDWSALTNKVTKDDLLNKAELLTNINEHVFIFKLNP